MWCRQHLAAPATCGGTESPAAAPPARACGGARGCERVAGPPPCEPPALRLRDCRPERGGFTRVGRGVNSAHGRRSRRSLSLLWPRPGRVSLAVHVCLSTQAQASPGSNDLCDTALTFSR